MRKIILISIFLFGCQKSSPNNFIQPETCTMDKTETEAIITCSDGSEFILPIEIIREEIEVEILVEVNKKCGKGHNK